MGIPRIHWCAHQASGFAEQQKISLTRVIAVVEKGLVKKTRGQTLRPAGEVPDRFSLRVSINYRNMVPHTEQMLTLSKV